MKPLLICIAFCCLYTTNSLSQSDATRYYTKNWKETTRDSAYYNSTFSYNDGLYKRTDVISKTMKPHMTGSFLDEERKARHGIFRWYYDSGALRDSIEYKNGKLVAGWYFYESGNRKATLTTVDGNLVEQGWDENGKEMPNFVLERSALFPGGSAGWKRYLERNLDANAAQKARAPREIIP